VSFFDRLLGRKEARRAEAMPVRVRGRFDAAESLDDRKHWQNADWFSLDGALTATVRRTMRNRARYERLNNSYLAGIADTLANDLVGTGPRLQLTTGNNDSDRAVETAFYEWTWHVNLAGKLRTMRQSKLIDGEAFAMMITNPRLDGVQLDLRLIEAEQVATPIGVRVPLETPEGSIVDGLEFDETGNVIAYKVLKYHPGSNYRVSNFEFNRVVAENMFHWFASVRPAQHRGVSEVAPCLRLFADMRRFTGAVIAAAETAADFAAFLHSNSPAAEVDEVDAFQSMEIEKRSMVTLPEGWSVSQLRAEQPVSTYAMFKREILNEIARSLQLPYNIAALDSSSYNYSSGRLDWQVYSQTIRVQRDDLERGILDRLFRAWCDEAALVGIIPSGMPPVADWTWTWTWDGREHVDPLKEANAAESRLRTHTTTLAAEYARQGKSWEVELRQRAAEVALMKELNLFVDLQPETNYGGTLDENGEPVPAGEQ
jgi:lambda family phage portal protein